MPKPQEEPASMQETLSNKDSDEGHRTTALEAASATVGRLGAFVASTLGGSSAIGSDGGRTSILSRGYKNFLLCLDGDEPGPRRWVKEVQAEVPADCEPADSDPDTRGESLSKELLAALATPGGSPEQKLELLSRELAASAQRLQGRQQQLLAASSGSSEELPREVGKVIAKGTYTDDFLSRFDGKSFLIYSEELVPYHECRLALEVHSGGAYWRAHFEADGFEQRVETVGLSCAEGFEGASSSSRASRHFGSFDASDSAQRGACFVWRWKSTACVQEEEEHEANTASLPAWVRVMLQSAGDDPLRKVQLEREALERWVEKVQLDTAKHMGACGEVEDIYVRAVLKSWPREESCLGGQTQAPLKRCAWVEGLDPSTFVGKAVQVKRVPYDDLHALALHARISKRSPADSSEEGAPPFVLTTSWKWTSAAAEEAAAKKASAAAEAAKKASTKSEPPRTFQYQVQLK